LSFNFFVIRIVFFFVNNDPIGDGKFSFGRRAPKCLRFAYLINMNTLVFSFLIWHNKPIEWKSINQQNQELNAPTDCETKGQAKERFISCVFQSAQSLLFIYP